MKTIVSILVFCICAVSISHAQEGPNSISLTMAEDSINRLVHRQIQLDSFKILAWSDSVRTRVNVRHSIDSVRIRAKVDSLNSLDLSSLPYTQKLDSLQRRKDALLNEVESKKQQALEQTTGRLEQWRTQANEKLGLSKLPGDHVPDLPGTQLPDIPGIATGDLKIEQPELPEIPSLSLEELGGMNLSTDLADITESISLPEIGQFDELQSALGKGSDALSSVSSLTTNPDQLVDQGFGRVSELADVKEQLQLADGISDNEFLNVAEKIKDPDALAEEVKQQVVKRAVNHFAGKEQVLQAAMEKMAKYKNQYESLNSLSELKKRPPNPMRGKPLVERIVPGVAFQILRNADLFLDLNPYASYRITGRLTSGIGWNQRISYSTKYNHFTSVSHIYGPRAFVEYKVWKGFSARLEGEFMNTVVPPLFKNPIADQGQREWVFTTMIGLKKEYRFIKNVKGTAFIMFNLFDHNHRSPYGDVVNSRFGFEFPMKKGSVKKSD